MFSQISRYKNLNELLLTDAKGRRVRSVELRLLPKVTGTFLHTIEQVDRLDHLAYKYYGESKKWWHICDANPEFMTPLALMGHDPVMTVLFSLKYKGSESPSWNMLVKQLAESPGVHDIKVMEDVEIEPENQNISGQEVVVYTQKYNRGLFVIFNNLNISIQELISVINSSDFEVLRSDELGRIGKQLVIPRNRTE